MELADPQERFGFLRGGHSVSDPARDLAKIAVVERHRGTGRDAAESVHGDVVLALSVVPELKITDRGLVDVERFELVPLEV